jgi:signal transduction histidine kinase/ActR/RegA family two-component response regulator
MRPRGADSAASPAERRHWVRRWWLDRPVRTKGLIVVAVPLIALVGTTAASLVLQHNEQQARSVAVAGRNLTLTADQVLADAVNAKTGVRGYAATGDSLFLAPYQLALTRISADREALRTAAVAEGDTRQQQRVNGTTGAVFLEMAQLRSRVSRGLSAGDLRSVLEQETVTMDRLRGQMAELAGGPAALILARSAEITRQEQAIDTLNIAALVLGMLAGLIGVALFTLGISRRVVAAAANADRLGERQPLEPADSSGDEFGDLSESLVRADRLLARYAAELRDVRDEALRATQAKNAFLSHTSHELRTPLNSILGFTQLLEMSDLCDEDRDSASRILGAGRHLLALINELIDISRIESGDVSLSVEPVSILPLVEEASQLMRPLAAERSITVIQHCARPDLAAHADRQRVMQILVNLLSNAVKYNRRGGTITVTGQEEGPDRISLVITDTGPGLSPDDLERIFVPFERLGAEQTAVEGSGIGLPLAKALAEAMSGRLSASSTPGEGSAFTISLPRAPDVTHVAPHETEPAAPAGLDVPAGAPIRILYIEDNPANIEVVARFLKRRPHVRLQSVATGRAGIDRAIQSVPDLILLDLHLSDLHGEKVLQALKAEPATAAIPVVVLSADATPGVIRRLRTDGAAAYLTKPVDLAELGALLDSCASPARADAADLLPRTTPA